MLTMKADDIKTFKDITSKLAKIAQDELSILPKQTAGPQEVIDALTAISKEIESVIASIPGGPTEEVEESPIAEARGDVPTEGEPVVDEEKKKMAQRIAELEKQVDLAEKSKVAQELSSMYANSEETYKSLMEKDVNSKTLVAQLEIIKDYLKNAKQSGSIKEAKTSVKVASLTTTGSKDVKLKYL